MNDQPSKIESMLGEGLFPELPESLRSNVEAAVSKRLRTQTFYDDLKWLGMSFGVLLAVVGVQYYLFASTTDKLRELTGSTISMVEPGELLKIQQSPASILNDVSSPN